jgi:hypothetical protein
MTQGLLEQLLYVLNEKIRIEQGREKEPSVVIVDSQSVKTPVFSGEEVSYDGGKKIKGDCRWHLSRCSPFYRARQDRVGDRGEESHWRKIPGAAKKMDRGKNLCLAWELLPPG